MTDASPPPHAGAFPPPDQDTEARPRTGMLPRRPEELEAAARARLSEAAYAYYAAGAGLEIGLEANVAAWQRWWLRPRMLRDVSGVSTATEVLGLPIRVPVLCAPCAVNRLAHPDGEAAVARACAEAGTVQLVSSASSLPIEEICAASDAPKWFQLYATPDPEVTWQRVRRAEEAGCRAIVLTVDLPAPGIRDRGLGRLDELPEAERAALRGLFGAANPRLTWEDVDRLVARSSLPVVLKGLLHPDDVRLAVEHGVAAVVVSNHGARQLDGSLPPALALPDCVAAAAGRLEVYVDGGVRTGTDVVRALALGARAVLVGRPYLWALALGGAAGVADLLERLTEETANVLAQCGQADARRVDPDIVVAR